MEIEENDGYVFYSEIAEPVGNGGGQARQYIYLPLVKYGKNGFNYGTKPDTAKFRFRRERPSAMWNSSLFQRLAKKPIIP